MRQESEDTEDTTDIDVAFRKQLGTRIREVRDAIKMKQDIAAMHVGVAVATFSRWEQGHFSPNLAKLIKLAEVLGVSLDTLCGVKRQPTPRSVILNPIALQQLEAAAQHKAALSDLKHLLAPPTVSVAFLVPESMQLVPPDQAERVINHVNNLVARLRTHDL